DGMGTIPDLDVAGLLRTRLDVNVVELAYASREISLEPHWGMRWQVGVRLANVFFDNRAGGLLVEERSSNSFWGAGPRAGLELRRHCATMPGLDLFARVDAAAFFGRIEQNFEATVRAGTPLAVGGAASVEGSQTVPVLQVQVGLGYRPEWGEGKLRLALG